MHTLRRTVMKAIILDIEGTTTPIDFVHEKLFPYAKTRMEAFVRENFENLASEVSQLVEEHESYGDAGNLDPGSPDSVSAYLVRLIEIDRKSTPLKSVQGKIWQAGYESGELRSEIFPDVPPALERWRAAGVIVAIYSSGSVLAQKLLFKFTDRGDLSRFISAHFDTTSGGKKEPASYRNIAAELNARPNEMLFVSDSIAELDAARAAGLRTAFPVRAGNPRVEDSRGHRPVETFDQLAA
jgi:enolase-phosphatase E1